MCVCGLLQHHMLFRSDIADYRSQVPDVDSGVEAGSDMTPPTPAFPISPPTPYGKYCMLFCNFNRLLFLYLCICMYLWPTLSVRFNKIRLLLFPLCFQWRTCQNLTSSGKHPLLACSLSWATEQTMVGWNLLNMSHVWGKKGLCLCNVTTNDRNRH